MSDIDAIAHLDWGTNEVRCQCENELCKPHGCRNKATRHVEFHAVGDCNRVDLQPFGNYVMLLCDHCLATLTQVIDQQRHRLNRHGIPQCGPCGAPMVERADWIRENRPL